MIRVGLVGFGMAGRVFHAPLISSVEGLELAAVVERNSSNAAERYPGITTYRSVEELAGGRLHQIGGRRDTQQHPFSHRHAGTWKQRKVSLSTSPLP